MFSLNLDSGVGSLPATLAPKALRMTPHHLNAVPVSSDVLKCLGEPEKISQKFEMLIQDEELSDKMKWEPIDVYDASVKN